jgi:hypothetical protein
MFTRILGLVALLAGDSLTGEERNGNVAGAGDLAWIAGDWRGEMDGGAIEERWAPPLGDSMMGMFRLVNGGKTKFLEFMTIERDGPALVLRLRHFSPGLIAWEEKDKPFTFRLVSRTGQEATFELDDKSTPTRLIYRRGSDGEMTVVLVKEQGGKQTTESFRFRRAGA